MATPVRTMHLRQCLKGQVASTSRLLRRIKSRSDKPLRANMKSQRRKFAEDIGDGGHGRSHGAGRPAINRQSTNKAPTLAEKQSGGAAACPYGTTDSRRNHIAGRSGGQKAQPPRLEAEWQLFRSDRRPITSRHSLSLRRRGWSKNGVWSRTSGRGWTRMTILSVHFRI